MGEQYIEVDPVELRLKASSLESTSDTLSTLSTSIGSVGLHPIGPVTGSSAPSAALVNALDGFETAWSAALKALATYTAAIASAMRSAADRYSSVDLLPLLPASTPEPHPQGGSR
ncbi:MAG: hypothetical protein JWM76_2546 [Pseudonocardiales bacterium]|nr:hypothetical protein [Pseudonocardiales bacterium]